MFKAGKGFYVVPVSFCAIALWHRVYVRCDEFRLEIASARKKINTQNLDCSICIKSASLSWAENPSKLNLSNINLEVKAGKKVAICGEVGSGKSTLLSAILGEVPIIQGNVQTFGTTAYVSQSVWIQTGSIRDNILFGLPMDNQRYCETLERCSLVKDLEVLPYGDLTEIGERGINLSGGHKQRIQLARALYQNADMYLLEDLFSAVDAETAVSLFTAPSSSLKSCSFLLPDRKRRRRRC